MKAAPLGEGRCGVIGEMLACGRAASPGKCYILERKCLGESRTMSGGATGLQRDGFDPSPVVSARMRRVHRADTKPELRLRRALWRHGLRFFKDRRLAGRHVDVVFPGARLAVLVDGCFWHGCPDHWRLPTKNRAYWEAKIGVVKHRDAQDTQVLTEAGWTVLRFWEHEIMSGLDQVVWQVEWLARSHGSQHRVALGREHESRPC